MGKLLAGIGLLLGLGGCAGPEWTVPPGQPMAAVAYPNPTLIAISGHEQVWEGVVDVVGEYFRIDHEEPVRLVGNTLTEGRLETFPKNGATLLEPWDHDSVTPYDRLESTFQSIRRWARVRVIPVPNGGFWVEVNVYKELENLKQPEHSTAGAATFPYDNSMVRVINPERPTTVSQGWIPQGRDTVLEQQIIAALQYRFTAMGRPVAL